MLKVFLQANPQSTDLTYFEIEPNQTITEIMGDRYESVAVYANGHPVPFSFFDHVRFKSGTRIDIKHAPQAGALVAAAAAVGSFVAANAGTFIAIGASAALSVASQLLFAPEQPKPANNSFRELNAITGSANEVISFEPMPKLFGRFRWYPSMPVSAQPYTEQQGENQYIRQYFILSHGKLDIGGRIVGDGHEMITQDDQLSDIDDQRPIRIGETDIGEYDECEYQIGTPDQITLYSDQVIETNPGWSSDSNADGYDSDDNPTVSDGDSAIRTTEENTEEISLDVRGNIYTVDSKGSFRKIRVKYRVEWRPTGSSNAWQSDEFTISGYGQKTATASYRITNLEPDQYDVRLTRVSTYFSNLEGSPSSEVEWNALRSIRKRRAFDMPNCVVMAVRIRATDQLNGRLDKLSVQATSVLPVYDPDGNQWIEKPTHNPAWAFTEVWTGSANRNPFDKSDLDLSQVSAWAQDNDHYGLTYNAIFDNKQNTLDRIKEICSAGRAVWNIDTKISVIRETADNLPKMLITPRNSFDYAYTLTSYKSPEALKVRFTDSETWEDGEVTVYDRGYSAANATEVASIQAPGCIDSQQAIEFGKFHLANERLRGVEQHEWSMDVHHLHFRRGEIVSLQNDAVQIGLGSGRITEVERDESDQIIGFYSDEYLTLGDDQYAVRIQLDDGSQTVAKINNISGHRVEFQEPIDVDLAYDSIFVFGIAGKAALDLKITSITKQRELQARIKAEPASVEEIQAVINDGEQPAFDPKITQPIDIERLPPSKPSIREVISDESVARRLDDGSLEWLLAVDVQANSGRVSTSYIEVQTKVDDPEYEQWKSSNAQSGRASFSGYSPGENVTIRARSVAKNGNVSDWVYRYNYQIQGRVPPKPVDVDIDRGTFSIKLSPRGGAPSTSYEVYRSTTLLDESDITSLGVLAGQGRSVTDTELEPDTQYYYWIRAVNVYAESDFYALSIKTKNEPGAVAKNLTEYIQNGPAGDFPELKDIGLITAGEDVEGSPANKVKKEADERADAIQAEAEERAQAVDQEIEDRKDAIKSESEERSTAISQEIKDRKDAIQAEADQRSEEILEESNKRAEEIQAEADERADKIFDESRRRADAIRDESAARQKQIADEITSISLITPPGKPLSLNTQTLLRDQETRKTLRGEIGDEAEARADALLNQRNELDAVIEQNQTINNSRDESLANSISEIAAGSGEQFDVSKIWYYDNDLDGWTGGTLDNGFLIADDGGDPDLISPDGIGVDGDSRKYVKARLRKSGNPDWVGNLYWQSTDDSDWQGPVTIDEPPVDVEGITTISWQDIPWSGEIDQIRIRLTESHSETDGYDIDWMAIGRPTPGASTAALQREREARITDDMAETTARETFAAQVRGDYEGDDPAGLSKGLIYEERQNRITENEALSRRADSIQTNVDDNESAIDEEAKTRSDETGSLAQRASDLEATSTEQAEDIARRATRTALEKVENDAESARGSIRDDLNAQFNDLEKSTDAQFADERKIRSDADSALTQRADALDAQYREQQDDIENRATNDRVNQVESDAEGARSTISENLTTAFQNADAEQQRQIDTKASNNRVNQLESSAEQAIATARDDLNTQYNDLDSSTESRFTDERRSRSKADQALSDRTTAVESKLGDPDSGLEANARAIDETKTEVRRNAQDIKSQSGRITQFETDLLQDDSINLITAPGKKQSKATKLVLNAKATESVRVVTEKQGETITNYGERLNALDVNYENQKNQISTKASQSELSRVENDAESARGSIRDDLNAQFNDLEKSTDAQFADERKIRSDADSALGERADALEAQYREQQDDISNRATIDRLDQVESDSEKARGTISENLTAAFQKADEKQQKDIENRATNDRVNQVESDAEGARSTLQENLTTAFQNADEKQQEDIDSRATNNRLDEVASDAQGARSTLGENLTTAFQNADEKQQEDIDSRATNDRVNQLESSAEQARASIRDDLNTQYNDLDSSTESRFTDERRSRSKADQALSDRTTAVESKLGDPDSGLDANANNINETQAGVERNEQRIKAESGRLQRYQTELLQDDSINLITAPGKKQSKATKLVLNAQATNRVKVVTEKQAEKITNYGERLAALDVEYEDQQEQITTKASQSELSRVENDAETARGSITDNLTAAYKQGDEDQQEQLDNQQDQIDSKASIDRVEKVESDAQSARGSIQQGLRAEYQQADKDQQEQLDDQQNQIDSKATINSVQKVESDAEEARSSLQQNVESQIDNSIAGVRTSFTTQVNSLSDKVEAQYNLTVTGQNSNGTPIVGGLQLGTDGDTVDLVYSVKNLAIQSPDDDGSLIYPFIYSNGQTVIQEALIESLTFGKLTDASGNFIVNENGELQAKYIEASQLVIGDLSGAGALASRDSADWDSQVTGSGKPESNADVTSNNVAKAIANQGGFATLDKMTRDNISAYMDSAAITNAYIGDAAVDTLQIHGQAVTQPSLSVSDSKIDMPDGSWQRVMSKYRNADQVQGSNAQITITGVYSAIANGGGVVDLRLERNGVTLFEQNIADTTANNSSASGAYCINVLDDGFSDNSDLQYELYVRMRTYGSTSTRDHSYQSIGFVGLWR